MKKTITILMGMVMVFGWASLVSATPVEWQVSEGGNGHYYELVDNAASWDVAKTSAEGRNFGGVVGYLATITSSAENNFIYNSVAAIPPEGFWIGGYQPSGSLEPAGSWRWVTDESWNFVNWAPNEPNNNASGEDKLQMYGSNGASPSQWNDCYTEMPLKFVVEYTVPEPSSFVLLSVGILSLLAYVWQQRRQAA